MEDETVERLTLQSVYTKCVERKKEQGGYLGEHQKGQPRKRNSPPFLPPLNGHDRIGMSIKSS